MPSLVQPLPKEIDEPVGINAVLLGPPGSGKGTQVSNVILIRLPDGERVESLISCVFIHHCSQINYVYVTCLRDMFG